MNTVASPKAPSVTIVMAEYNTNEEHFRGALESITRQTFTDFELIVVDDGGDNDVGCIISEFKDDRFKVIEHSVNRGFVAALTTGIAAASAPLIARMDTDDLYLPDHLERLVKTSISKPYFAAYSARSKEFSEDFNELLIGKQGEKRCSNVVRGDGLIHPATLIRKEAIINIGGYPNYRRAEDFGLWCEMLLKGYRLYMTNDITHYYRVELSDYEKRKLRNRGGEIRARLHYYPLLGATPRDYMKIVRSIAGGILPPRLVRSLRRWERRP